MTPRRRRMLIVFGSSLLVMFGFFRLVWAVYVIDRGLR